MGAIDELSGEGSGVVLAQISHNTDDEIAAARQYLARHNAEDLLPILGLDQNDH